jgi:hypothetical protein
MLPRCIVVLTVVGLALSGALHVDLLMQMQRSELQHVLREDNLKKTFLK